MWCRWPQKNLKMENQEIFSMISNFLSLRVFSLQGISGQHAGLFTVLERALHSPNPSLLLALYQPSSKKPEEFPALEQHRLTCNWHFYRCWSSKKPKWSCKLVILCSGIWRPENTDRKARKRRGIKRSTFNLSYKKDVKIFYALCNGSPFQFKTSAL